MDTAAPIQTLAQRIREIPVGQSRWFGECEAAASTVKTTLTRLKKRANERGQTFEYTTRPQEEYDLPGLRVWRLS